jgi:hypothetical protein
VHVQTTSCNSEGTGFDDPSQHNEGEPVKPSGGRQSQIGLAGLFDYRTSPGYQQVPEATKINDKSIDQPSPELSFC